MTPENFCYWLRGYIEILKSAGQPLDLEERQVELINAHLNLVLKPVTQTQPSPRIPNPFFTRPDTYC